DEIKDHQCLSSQPLRSKLPVLVLQELSALLLAHSAVRALALEAAQTKGLDPDRVSFTQSIRVLKSGLNRQSIVDSRPFAAHAQASAGRTGQSSSSTSPSSLALHLPGRQTH